MLCIPDAEEAAIDSLVDIPAGPRPVDNAFVSGTLMLPHTPSPSPADHAVGGDVLSTILIIVSILALIAGVRRLANIFPSLLGCLGRWKEALNTEYSVKLSRDRDIVYALLFIPGCLLINKFSLLLPDFVTALPPLWHLLAVIGCFVVYGLVRMFLNMTCKGKKIDKTAYDAAFKLFRTFFCLTVLVCLATGGILSFTNLPADTLKVVLFYVTAFFYLFFLFRKGQILLHYCSVLSTILYLCILEILPMGICIATAIIM